MNKRRAAVALGISLLLTLGALGAHLYYSSQDEAPALVQAPDFTLRDLAGSPVTLSETGGRVRVVNVWASWSPYSRIELPLLAEIAKEKKWLDVYALSRDVNENDARTFLKELGLEESGIHFVLDPGDSYFKEMSGFNMPETLILNEDGGILLHVRGPMTREVLESALEAAR